MPLVLEHDCVIAPVEKLHRLKAACHRVINDAYGPRTAALESLEDLLDELFMPAPSIETLGQLDD